MNATASDPPLILVVDDDDDVREALASALAEEGYRVEVAQDGLDALDVLAHRPIPRLIVLDLTMPRLNGSDFRRRMHADLPELCDVPLVVMSADAEGRSVARGLGATAFLRKPIRLAELLRTVDEELHRFEPEA